MRYGVVINLDYQSYAPEVLSGVWGKIKSQMERSGFREDGRVFTIDRPESEAGALARQAVEQLESSKEYYEMDIYSYIKEFYGFDMSETQNLLLPPVSSDLVELEVTDGEAVPDMRLAHH